jgi:iron complex transport system ATP-binding protein
MHIEGVSVASLANKLGTPLMIYNEKELENRLKEFKTCFSHPEFETQVIYASKAFSCNAMLRLVKDAGCGLDAVSGGELQMVLIARALTINPKMLVLDEPESNLDFRNQLIMLETIRDLSKKRGISAIVNTHYPEHALKISDKALILNREGRNMFGYAEDVINEENMKQAFSVQVHINQFEYRGAGYRSVVPLYLV